MDMPNDQKEEIRQQLRQAALEYHEFPTPGKISVTPTKQLTNQRDLALAYTPGVAAACEEIVVDPANAARLADKTRQAGGDVRTITYPGSDTAQFEQNLRHAMPSWMAFDMRLMAERFITGDASPKEKFLAWARTVPVC